MTVTLEVLKEYLHYDSASGIFTWIKAASRRVKVGDVAGSAHSEGYVCIGLKGESHYAHILAWWMYTGVIPSGLIDHRNGIKHDNRIGNLREASYTSNAQNCGKHSDNECGYKGVAKNRKKFSAKIHVNGKKIHLGSFATPEEAARAYDARALQEFGEFAKTNANLKLLRS